MKVAWNAFVLKSMRNDAIESDLVRLSIGHAIVHISTKKPLGWPQFMGLVRKWLSLRFVSFTTASKEFSWIWDAPYTFGVGQKIYAMKPPLSETNTQNILMSHLKYYTKLKTSSYSLCMQPQKKGLNTKNIATKESKETATKLEPNFPRTNLQLYYSIAFIFFTFSEPNGTRNETKSESHINQ